MVIGPILEIMSTRLIEKLSIDSLHDPICLQIILFKLLWIRKLMGFISLSCSTCSVKNKHVLHECCSFFLVKHVWNSPQKKTARQELIKETIHHTQFDNSFHYSMTSRLNLQILYKGKVIKIWIYNVLTEGDLRSFLNQQTAGRYIRRRKSS